MKYAMAACLFSLHLLMSADNLHDILTNSILSHYKRPITILYVSHNPEYIHLSQDDVIVFWGKQNPHRSHAYSNVIVLRGEITLKNMIDLSYCEHFDIAIIDIEGDISLTHQKVHLADHTLYITKTRLSSLPVIGTINTKRIFWMNKPKTILHNNWWRSCSDHKNYTIISNYDEKYFIKKKEYVDTKKEKKYRWIPGINAYTFFSLGGIYPSPTYIREKVLETFDPAICKDFGLANLILQGREIRAIDFDTYHLEDPYNRLKRTIELQMRMKYN